MAVSLDPRVTVPLSVLMIFFASIPLNPKQEFHNIGDQAVFTEFRTPDGEAFLKDRVERAYVHYSLLHALPAVIWSVVMPLQFWDHLRKTRPRLHRICGYTAFTCSFTLAISGLLFVPRKLSYSDPVFSVHKVFGVPLLPTFNFSVVSIVFPLFLFTGIRALQLARQKKFAEHRRWTTLHGLCGYLIPLQRVWVLLALIFGHILKASAELQEYLQTTKLSVPQKSDAERAAFAFTVYGAAATAILWGLRVFRNEIKIRKKTLKTS